MRWKVFFTTDFGIGPDEIITADRCSVGQGYLQFSDASDTQIAGFASGTWKAFVRLPDAGPQAGLGTVITG